MPPAMPRRGALTRHFTSKFVVGKARRPFSRVPLGHALPLRHPRAHFYPKLKVDDQRGLRSASTNRKHSNVESYGSVFASA